MQYDQDEARKRYSLLIDDMLYNIIINLRNNNISFEDLSDGLGLQTEELLEKLASKDKDFFVCLESISYLEEQNLYQDHSRINLKTKSK